MSDLVVNAVNWGLTGGAIGLTIGRYLIRAGSPGRFHWDDVAHGLALVLLIVHGATNQITNNEKEKLASMAAQTPPLPQNQLLAEYEYVAYLNTINNCFLYLIFWVVKIAFLLFYRTLFGSSRKFNYAWWAVLVFTLLTFWVPIAGVIATCAGASTLADYKACDGQTQARIVKLIYSCVVNVVSDVAVMVLPLWMLRGLQMRTRQKIGLAFLFSLATFDVALDILRTAQAVAQNQALYTIIELNVAVIVSCLPTFQALLVMGRRARSQARYTASSSGGSGSWRRLRPRAKASPWSSQGSTVRAEREGSGGGADEDLEYGAALRDVQVGRTEPEKGGRELGAWKGPAAGSEAGVVHVTRSFALTDEPRDAALGMERPLPTLPPLGPMSGALDVHGQAAGRTPSDPEGRTWYTP